MWWCKLRMRPGVPRETASESAIGDGDDAAECGVSAREAADFVVYEAGRFGGVDDVNFADVLLAFGVDHPDCAVLGDGFSKQGEALQSVLFFGAEKYQIDVGCGFAFGE